MDILPQLITNGIIIGSVYALIALGLTLYYGTLGFLNFAHGDIAALGAYTFFLFKISLGWPLVPSVLITILIITIIGLILERLIFRPVQDAPNLTPLLISIGVALFLQAMMLLIFSSTIRSLYVGGVIAKGHSFFNDHIIITNTQILIIITNIILFTGLFLFLKKTKLGKTIRAVSDNKPIAKILGVNSNRIIALIFALSSALAAIAGMLIGYEQNLQPTMGLQLGIKAFAAIVLGGIGSIPGAIIGGLVIGLAENLAIGISIGGFSIPSSYKDAIGFVVFIIVIFFRPYGIFGSKTEVIRK